MKKILIILILLIGLPLALGGSPSNAIHVDSERIITLPIRETASIMQLSPSYETNSTFLSEIFESEMPFQLLGLNWNEELPAETEAQLEIRFRSTDGEWTDWEAIHEDQDGIQQEDDLYTYFITENSDAFQYRALLSTGDTSITPKLSNISFDYVNGGETSTVSKLQKLIFQDGSDLISRSEWGADKNLLLAENYASLAKEDDIDNSQAENLAADDPDMEIVKTVTKLEGKELLWPLQYPKKVKKIIIHHTATTSNLDDPEQAIRAIYYYHAVTRGWGDIGYNYIIAPDGTVYEGRYGGDGVVAGHAAGYNTGSVGIALLGNYEEAPVPGELMQSLTDLIYEKAELHGIDADASSKFRGNVIPNILAHRDVSATQCPGTYSYDYMTDIRNIVGASLDNRRHTNSSETFAYEEVTNRELLTLDPNDSAGIQIKIKNTGTKRWNSDTFLTVNANYEADSLVTFKKDANKSVAKMRENYVDPGGTATFSFTISSALMGGLGYFDMAPVFNGTEKTRNYMDLAVYVERPSLEFDVTSKDAPSKLKPGESATVEIKMKNEGNLTWTNSGTYKVTLKKSGSSSLTSDSTLATLTESEVKPGKTGTFTFKIKAPSTGGKYSLYFTPSMDNSNAFVGSASNISVEVTGSTEEAVASASDISLMPGESKFTFIEIKNNSSETWTTSGSNAFQIAVTKPKGVEVTDPKIRLRSVSPGVSTKAFFTITAPDEPGDYTVYFRPRLGNSNLTNSSITLTLNVSEEPEITSNYENPIRVRITPDKNLAPVVTSTGTFALYEDDEQIRSFSANSRVRIISTPEYYLVSSGTQNWKLTGAVKLIPNSGGILQIMNLSQRPAWNTSLNDNLFRGSLEFQTVGDENLIINELDLEDYLKGIAEVSNNTNEEKIKTIIVLARTYAAYYMTEDDKFPGMPYDLDDDPDSSQKYLGYGFEKRSPNVAAAVADTEGEVVTYNGRIVKTPYFSQSDGTYTKSAQSVWGWTNTPYLQAVSDEYCDANEFLGHGVGLSGCGADAMAEEGYTYDEIIRYYYTDVDLSSL